MQGGLAARLKQTGETEIRYQEVLVELEVDKLLRRDEAHSIVDIWKEGKRMRKEGKGRRKEVRG